MNIYYITNRAHTGDDRWNPTGYGHRFSSDGFQNLRYGTVETDASSLESRIDTLVNEEADGWYGNGDGVRGLINGHIQQALTINAYRELPDGSQVGSQRFYAELMEIMKGGKDVVVYVHGYNNDWLDSVASAMALKEMINRQRRKEAESAERRLVEVVLFSWPSDGRVLLYTPYFSDRQDAAKSDTSLGRALKSFSDELERIKKNALGAELMTWRDYAAAARENRVDPNQLLCRSSIHLLAHSMGNYVLEKAMELQRHENALRIPERLFDSVFMCAPDVDSDALEPDKPLAELTRLASRSTVYFNKQDVPLLGSVATKNFRERLGRTGASRPSNVNRSFYQVDCTDVVTEGFSEHGYYLNGTIMRDIRDSIQGVRHSMRDYRKGDPVYANQWILQSSEL